jgi:hypothetical protein
MSVPGCDFIDTLAATIQLKGTEVMTSLAGEWSMASIA